MLGSSVFGGFSFNPTDVQETKQGLAKVNLVGKKT